MSFVYRSKPHCHSALFKFGDIYAIASGNNGRNDDVIMAIPAENIPVSSLKYLTHLKSQENNICSKKVGY